nr:unnamed protein product [Callosobruchus analis]
MKNGLKTKVAGALKYCVNDNVAILSIDSNRATAARERSAAPHLDLPSRRVFGVSSVLGGEPSAGGRGRREGDEHREGAACPNAEPSPHWRSRHLPSDWHAGGGGH